MHNIVERVRLKELIRKLRKVIVITEITNRTSVQMLDEVYKKSQSIMYIGDKGKFKY